MLIRCPQCQFTQEIHPARIPAAAVMATCPRCKNRFRFRTLNEDDAADPAGAQPATEKAAEPAPQPPVPPRQPENPLDEQNGDDPLPPGAVIPQMTSAEDPRPTAPQTHRPSDPDAAAKPASSLRSGPEPRSFAGRVREAASGMTNAVDAAEEERDIPWENEAYSLWGGLYHTILRVLFGAPRFFGVLSKATGPLTRPVLFYIILGMFQTVAKLLWFHSVAPSITDPRVQELLSSAARGISVPMTLLLAPGLLALQLLLYSGLFYLMLRLVQPERAVYAVVLRVVAYSSAPMVLTLVPFLGPVAAPIWFAVCCFIGCKYALRLSWHQVALALVPLYLIAFAVAVQLVQRLAQG